MAPPSSRCAAYGLLRAVRRSAWVLGWAGAARAPLLRAAITPVCCYRGAPPPPVNPPRGRRWRCSAFGLRSPLPAGQTWGSRSAVLACPLRAPRGRLRVPWLTRSHPLPWVITPGACVRRRFARRVPARRWVRYASPSRLRPLASPCPPPSAALRPGPSASLRGRVFVRRSAAPRAARGVPTFLQGSPPSPRRCVPASRFPFRGLCPPSPGVFFMGFVAALRPFFVKLS